MIHVHDLCPSIKKIEGHKGDSSHLYCACPLRLSYTVIRNQSVSVRKDCDKNTRGLNVLEASDQ